MEEGREESGRNVPEAVRGVSLELQPWLRFRTSASLVWRRYVSDSQTFTFLGMRLAMVCRIQSDFGLLRRALIFSPLAEGV